MDRRTRHTRNRGARDERMPMYARLHVSTLDGKPVAPLGRCTNISLGGLRVTAAEGMPPGTRLQIEVELPSGTVFRSRGRVTWSITTLHPGLFGTPTGKDDDAKFGVSFDDASPEALMPIARLFLAREDERRRTRRIRRLHPFSIHA